MNVARARLCRAERKPPDDALFIEQKCFFFSFRCSNWLAHIITRASGEKPLGFPLCGGGDERGRIIQMGTRLAAAQRVDSIYAADDGFFDAREQLSGSRFVYSLALI